MTEKFNTPIINEILSNSKEGTTMVGNNTNNNATVNNATVKEGTAMGTQTINNTTTNNNVKEDKNMKNALKEMMGKVGADVKNFAGNVKVEVDAETQTIKTNLDDHVNVLKNDFLPVLGYIGEVLGLVKTKDELCEIIYTYGKNGKSQNTYFEMARKCQAIIDRKIKMLEAVNSEESIKKAIALKQINGEGEEYTQSIWMSFAKGIVWLCKKAASIIAKKFGTDESTNIFGAVGAKIAGVISTIFNIGKALVGVVGTVAKFAFSYVAAATLKIAAVIVDVFKTIFSKFKGFITDKFNKAEDFEDDFDDDFDTEFGAY